MDEVRSGSLRLDDKDKEHIISLYDFSLKYVDDQIGLLIQNLKDKRLMEKTIIIIHPDHGEEFWDHDGFEHGHTMYNELLRVPLIIVHPKIKNIQIDQTIRLIDVFPTLMGFLGIDIPFEIRGNNISKEIAKGKAPNLIAFSEATLYGKEQKSIQDNNYKLILNNTDYEFYDMSKDQKEENPLADHPLFEKYKRLLSEHMSEGKNFTGSEKEFEKKALEQLKSLGYI